MNDIEISAVNISKMNDETLDLPENDYNNENSYLPL